MENRLRFRERVPRLWLCVACQEFSISPAGDPVDLTGESEDPADALCTIHRARTTEGCCVVCARRLPWVAIDDTPIGCCRPCFVERIGRAAAERVEAALDEETEEEHF